MATTSESNITHMHPRKALVIGNNSYTRNPLKNCVNDANDLADKLQTLDFQVEKGINCTYQQIDSLIKAFKKSIQKQDLVLFFFAGHGVQYKEQNYLLPVDADDAIDAEEDIETSSINARNTMENLASRTLYITIFILDCCRSYKLPSNGRTRGKENRTSGLHAMTAPGGTLLQFACGPGTPAKDGDTGDRNGLYTKHLLHHIDTPDIALDSIWRMVTRGVYEESKGDQMPHSVSTLMILEPIYLNKQDPNKTPISGNPHHFLLTIERRNPLVRIYRTFAFFSYYL